MKVMTEVKNRGVQAPEIQKISGALQGQRARKGIFITTSAFLATKHLNMYGILKVK